MLKHLKFSGIFSDDDLSVHITLENPMLYGFTVADLLFSVTARAKNNSAISLKPEEFAFYVMDESGCMYDTRYMTTPAITNTQYDEEPYPQPDWLIVACFKADFLYQDLRIAFNCYPYQKLCIIELQH